MLPKENMIKGERYEIQTATTKYTGTFDGIENNGVRNAKFVKLKGNRGKHILLHEKLIQNINEVQ